MLMFRYFLILFRVIIFVFGYMPSYRVGGLESLELESWTLRDIPSVNVDRQPRL